MERLLASQMSTGALVRIEGGAGQGGTVAPGKLSPAVYVPINEVAPQPIPKPRGRNAVRAGRSAESKRANHDGGEAQPPPPWTRSSGQQPARWLS